MWSLWQYRLGWRRLKKRQQRALLAIIIVGGFDVLASYAVGFLSHSDSRWDLWGGVPGSLRSLYAVTMLLAAVGFFPFTLFILFRLEPSSTRIAGRFRYGFFLASYAVILFAPAAWMPLTFLMLE